MTLEDLRNYCLSKPSTSESFPFDNEILVFKVLNKMFILTNINDEILSFNAKSDPEKAIEWREMYDWVSPGYHMNKKHWNTIDFNGNNTKLLKQFIDHSYSKVIESMTKKEKELLNISN